MHFFREIGTELTLEGSSNSKSRPFQLWSCKKKGQLRLMNFDVRVVEFAVKESEFVVREVEVARRESSLPVSIGPFL